MDGGGFFRRFLSPEAARELDAERAEVARLFGLSDRWLAEELLRLVRAVRDSDPGRLSLARHRDGGTYDTSFVWGIVPEIAFRLGATRFLCGERGPGYSSLCAQGLRDWTGDCFRWLSLAGNAPSDGMLKPAKLLERTFVNGNPVAIGLDRAAPPGPESADWVVRHTLEIARLRGHGDVVSWSPAMNVQVPRAGEAVADAFGM